VGIVSRRDLLRSYIRSDAVLQEEISDRVIRRVLWLDPATITVEVRDGVVTISGEVETKSLAGITIRLIRAVDGVIDVVDRLTYSSDDATIIAQDRPTVDW
jgi:osmotically-inducible protein OsmY